MKNLVKKQWPVIILIAVASLLVGLGVKFYYENKIDNYLTLSQENINQQRSVIEQLQTGLRTGGDTFEQAVEVADCTRSSRIRFDELLSELTSLNRGELLELEEMFNDCAYYYATVQTVAVGQLAREIAVYQAMLNSVAVFSEEAQQKLALTATWDEMLTKETERARLHNQLVNIQRAIVEELLAYKSENHPDIQTLANEGQEIRNNIIFLTQQIDELRTRLTDS